MPSWIHPEPSDERQVLFQPAHAIPPSRRRTRGPPCTRNSTSIIPSQRIRPWRFKPGTHPAKAFRWHRAIASQFQHHRQRNDHHASSGERWNVHEGSAGLEAFLLRSRLLSGGFKKLIRDVVSQRWVSIFRRLEHSMTKPIDFT